MRGLVLCRPWGRFRKFEGLKVTVGSSPPRWVIFLDDGRSHGRFSSGDAGDEQSPSIGGLVHIFDSCDQLQQLFGQAGMMRTFGLGRSLTVLNLLSMSVSDYDLDHLVLLEYLEQGGVRGGGYLGVSGASGAVCTTAEGASGADAAGAAASSSGSGGPPHAQSQAAWDERYAPLIQRQTSEPGGARGDDDSECPTMEDTTWLCAALPALQEFLLDDSGAAMCKPASGVVRRVYTQSAGQHQRGQHGRAKAEQTRVEIEYNMDEGNGGLWDRDRKWMWFD